MGSVTSLPSGFLQPTVASAVRSAAHQLASAVSVVTVGAGETRAGLTAMSVSLLSTDPPTLLVCLPRAATAYGTITRAPAFAVNVLSADQREIAEGFAGHPEAAKSADGRRWLPLGDGLACLADCAAVFECEAEETIERGATALVIGRARRALIGGGSGALVRWRGVYDQIGWSEVKIRRAVGLRAKGAPGRT